MHLPEHIVVENETGASTSVMNVLSAPLYQFQMEITESVEPTANGGVRCAPSMATELPPVANRNKQKK